MTSLHGGRRGSYNVDAVVIVAPLLSDDDYAMLGEVIKVRLRRCSTVRSRDIKPDRPLLGSNNRNIKSKVFVTTEKETLAQ